MTIRRCPRSGLPLPEQRGRCALCGLEGRGTEPFWCPARGASVGEQTLGEDAEEAELLGNYELLDTLGQGGIGVVYRARDLDTERLVALKLLTGGAHASERQLERFEREIDAQQRRDPGIVRVLDRGRSPRGPWARPA